MIAETSTILVIHAAATWAMTGLIWFIQLVHYPAYRQVGAANFASFQFRSPARTGVIVGPLMFTELGTAAWLLWQRPTDVAPGWLWMGAALIAICWASTVLLLVPIHLLLTLNREDKTVERLIRTNWLRTIAWSIRAVLVATWLLALMSPHHSARLPG
jgi:hypothetical protein